MDGVDMTKIISKKKLKQSTEYSDIPNNLLNFQMTQTKKLVMNSVELLKDCCCHGEPGRRVDVQL